MARRSKNPSVTPEKAREWLRRVEDNAESAPQIAKTDGFDVRTVRKNVEKAREERERRESRQMVLRRALEMHYADLCSLAEKIRADLTRNTPSKLSISLKDDPLYQALKEHVPRLRLWRDIERLGDMEDEFGEAVTKLKQRVATEAEQGLSLPIEAEPGKPGLGYGFVEAMLSHLVNKAGGGDGLEGSIYKTTTTDSGVRLVRSSFTIAHVPEVKRKEIQSVFDNMMVQALEWDEYHSMSRILSEFNHIMSRVTDELTKIILRRIVPGRCIYCPF